MAVPQPKDALHLKYEEAVAYFRGKTKFLTREEWDALTDEARQRAFTVAGVARVDVLRFVWERLDRAIAEGKSLEDFKRDVTEALEREWDGTVANPGRRIETIYRTNAQQAFAAGRHRVSSKPEVRRLRPYQMFDAVIDGATTHGCRARNGITLPADDPWWRSNTPPRHFDCRSGVVSLRESQAKRQGITEKIPDDLEPTTEGFGKPPDLTAWQPDPADYPAPLRPFLPAAE